MRISLHPFRVWNGGARLVKFAWNSQVRRVSIDSPPTFLVGNQHSGTSVSLAVLGAHSRIHAIPYETKLLEKNSELWFRTGIKNFNIRAIAAGKQRWVEKTPNHILKIEQILEWCPEAQIILVIRDGRDVAASMKKRTGRLQEGIENWVARNRHSQKFWDHPNVHVFKYEDLITDFDQTLQGILHFLGEDYEPQMRNYHETPRRFYSLKIKKPENAFGTNHKQHRNWQINQPIFDGRGRWKNLSSEELDLVYEIGGDLLNELGYLEEEYSRQAA